MEWSRRKFINAGIAGSLGVFSISAGIKWPGGKRKLPGGFWPVMMTPFNEDLSIDYTGLKHLIHWYEEAGSQGLFANCASSEMYQLSPEERIELTRFVVKHSNVPVVSTGTFYDDVDRNVEFIRRIHQTGVDAVVIIPSVIVGKEKSDQDMMKHFGELIDKTSDIPLGIYECPSPYRRLIEPDKLEQLTKSDRFLYFKDTSCDELLVEEKIKVSADSSLGIYNAHSPDVLHSIRHGGAGISCIAGNFYPELFSYLWKEGRTETVSPSVKKVNDFILANDRVIGKKYSVAAKYFMQIRGLPVAVTSRRSTQTLDTADKDRLDQLWNELQDLGESLNIEIV
ncbi:MAG: dihydrodipicolinate synthase family protein [Cyclobacteriaceae bacterium]